MVYQVIYQIEGKNCPFGTYTSRSKAEFRLEELVASCCFRGKFKIVEKELV